MGTWMPIESLFNLKEPQTKKTGHKKRSTPNNIPPKEVKKPEEKNVSKVVDIQKEASPKAWNQLLKWVDATLLNIQAEPASESVERLKNRFPHKSQRELAHALIAHKSLQIAGCTALRAIPKAEDILAGLFGIELPTVAKMSAEMVYQIALIYGHGDDYDKIHSDILVAFGIGLLGDKAIDHGIDWLKYGNFTSTALSASAKALMIFGIGHAACFYYENYNKDLKTLKAGSQEYLDIGNGEEPVKKLINREYEDHSEELTILISNPVEQPKPQKEKSKPKDSTVTKNPKVQTKPTVDYSKLTEYLEQKRWKDADIETGLIIQQLIGGGKYLVSYDSIGSLPAKDIAKINELWSNASKKKFGFASQKQIYKQSNKNIEEFGEKIAWRGHKGKFGGTLGWRSYHFIDFKDDAPKGHLPACWLRIAPGLNGGSKIDNSLKAILERDDWQ